MKNFFEKLKDFIYDGIDYIMIIGVIAIVALIINWRLNGLFAEDGRNTIPKKQVQVINNTPSVSNDKNRDKPNENDDLDKNTKDNIQDDNKENLDEPNSDILVKISIPAGSLPSKIGSILESNGLVKDKNEFVQKAIELKLETKLKYGEFEISKNSSIEEILKILTK